jgi:glycerophosphoryl diester phosphodiesterase
VASYQAAGGKLVKRVITRYLVLSMLAFACTLGWDHALQAAPQNPFLRGAARLPVPLNIAHAGASSVAPQNTLVAGRVALKLGADVWGVDVRLTRDGVFVLMHDKTLDRTTDVEGRFPARSPWRVEEFTLKEIRGLDAGSWFVDADPFEQIKAGYVSRADLEGYVGEPVPTLREALEFVAQQEWLMDIEVKPGPNADPEGLAHRLLAVIGKTGTADRVMVSSFDHDILRALKRLNPAIPIGALTIFAPFDAIAYLNDLGADLYLPSMVGCTEDLLTELSQACIGVHVWTYNSEGQLERLAGTPGIAGIYTDFPQRLAPILERLRHAGQGVDR